MNTSYVENPMNSLTNLSSEDMHSTPNGVISDSLECVSDLISAFKYSILKRSALFTSTLVSELLLSFDTGEKRLTNEAEALATEIELEDQSQAILQSQQP